MQFCQTNEFSISAYFLLKPHFILWDCDLHVISLFQARTNVFVLFPAAAVNSSLLQKLVEKHRSLNITRLPLLTGICNLEPLTFMDIYWNTCFKRLFKLFFFHPTCKLWVDSFINGSINKFIQRGGRCKPGTEARVES